MELLNISFSVSHEDISSDSSEEADSKEKTAAISSPIRVTPERDLDRKNGSSSKWHKDKRRSTSGTSNKLSVKERLFVSRKTIGKTSSGWCWHRFDCIVKIHSRKFTNLPSLIFRFVSIWDCVFSSQTPTLDLNECHGQYLCSTIMSLQQN